MSARLAFAIAFIPCIGFAGCGSDGHPPTARIAFSPEWLPVGDGYRTDVTLDGTASRNDIEDPSGIRPLAFQWTIDDPHLQIVVGSLAASTVTVRLAAVGPTVVELAVSDSGGEGRATAYVGVTVPAGP